ncbi:unnamed protein product [Symbiodinium sp. CCMP2456]|nr:unnamed protein product [Symbiodinium sp. CCMP2456]
MSSHSRKPATCMAIMAVSAFVVLVLASQTISFAQQRGVNRRMEEEAKKRGWKLRTPVSESGWDDHNLSREEAISLSMISSAAQGLEWYKARSAWEKSSQGKTPLYNSVMHAAYRCGQYGYGRSIFRRMCKKSLPKNSITFNCAIRLFVQSNETDKVFELWDEAKSQTGSWERRQIYLLMSEMVNAMGDFGNITGVITFLDLILKEELEIDEGTWGSALNGCKVAGKPHTAKYFLEEMRSRSVPINLIHYTHAIAAHAGRKLESITAFAKMVAQTGIDIDEYFVEMHVTSLMGSLRRTHETKNMADVRKVVSKAKPSHAAEALRVIEASTSKGMKLTRLTRRFHQALLEP